MNLKDVKLGLDLNSSNAVQWFHRMELLLRSVECWTTVTTDVGDVKTKDAARLAISCNVGDDLIHIVDPAATPKQIWDALKKQFSGISAARKMALARSQASFRKLADETLDHFITRAEQLRAELATAQMLKPEEFVLMFLAALDETDYMSWSQAVSAQKPLPSFSDLTENLRATFFSKLHATSASASSQSQAYQMVGDQANRQQCDYCHKSGHSILQCFKLKNDQHAYENDPNAGRGRGRGRGRHGRGRGRGGGRGRGRGSNANQASTSAFVCISAHNVSTNRSRWLFDSATTDHMVNDAALLHDAAPFQSTCTVANKQTAPVTAIGTVKLQNHLGNTVDLKNVMLVPSLQHNLISLTKADAAGLHFAGKNSQLALHDQSNKQLLLGSLVDGLYEVKCDPVLCSSSPAMQTALATQGASATLWHRRFGHAGHSTLAKMSRGKTVHGLPPAQEFEQQLKTTAVCTPCAEGKMKRESFPATSQRSTVRLHKLHTDIAGPFSTSPGGANYFLMVVDDCSSYKIVQPLPRKSDAADALKNVILGLQNKYDARVAEVRFDRDSVFLSDLLQSFLKQNGTESQPTSGYSPQENGHAERAIGTLSELRDALIADSGLKKAYWAEAVMHGAYLCNIMCSDGGKSPWELLKGTKPDISNLHVWGCTCFVKIPNAKRRKGQLPAKAEVGKFVGYAQPNFKAFRVLLPDGRVTTSRDVSFDESAPPASDARVELCSDLMDAVLQRPALQQPAPQQPAPQQPAPQQPAQQQAAPAQQPLAAQPQQIQLMANNPLFDAAAVADDPQPRSEPATPRRNPQRDRRPPDDPYQKYLHGLPGAHSSLVNFHL